MKKIQKHIPMIGLRIIKSGIAVALCFVIAYFRGNEGIVFYSLLSALWCIQMYRSNTKKNAIQRFSGTVIGALYGLVFLLLSCVVFLSIAVNHAMDVNPYYFVWNRFLDTCIGIGVGIFVNDFSLPLKKKTDILFVSGLDDTLLNENSNLTDYAKVELNRMLEKGLLFTISTIRTPASLMEPMRDIHLKLPVIAMDGAVLYDMEEKMYRKVYVMSSSTSQKVLQLLRENGLECFVNIIMDDMLVIYYSESENPAYNNVVKTLRRSPFRNYVKREPPQEEEVVYFMILEQREKVEQFYRVLTEHGWEKELKIIKYDSDQYPGYEYMKIYNKNATKENMMEYLKEMTGIRKTVTFGTIPGRYDVTIREGDSNKVVHIMKRYFEYGREP